MSGLPQSGTIESITLNASAAGVRDVVDGPSRDAIDHLEYLEAQLRCNLLCARIRSVRRETKLRAFVVRRGVLRLDCIIVLTVLALGWAVVSTAPLDPVLLRGLILVLGVATAATARSSHFRLQ